MTKIARRITTESPARFTIYADITIWTESAKYPNQDGMITDLQCAVAGLEKVLPDLGLSLAPHKTEFLAIFGRKPPIDYVPPQVSVTSISVSVRLEPIKLLGVYIGTRNSPAIWLNHLKQKWNFVQHTLRRLSNKHGGAEQKAITTLGREVAVGILSYYQRPSGGPCALYH